MKKILQTLQLNIKKWISCKWVPGAILGAFALITIFCIGIFCVRNTREVFPEQSNDSKWDKAVYSMLEKDTQAALSGFAQILQGVEGSAEMYRDYGVALILDGKTEEAKQCLTEAKKKNLSNDGIYLLEGGIAYASGQRELAMEKLNICLKLTKDESVRYYAYDFCAEIYQKEAGKLSNTPEDTRTALESELELWTEASEVTGERYAPYVCRALQAVSLNLYETTGDDGYLEIALSQMERAREQQWTTYGTYLSMASVLEQLGRYEDARTTLKTAIATYGETWTGCGLLAIIEAEYQNELPKGQRNYREFLNLYENASVLHRNTDVEQSEQGKRLQSRLDEIYRQISQGGWLDEI